MRSNKNGGVRVLIFISVVLVSLIHVKSEATANKPEVEESNSVDTFSEAGSPEQSSPEIEQQISEESSPDVDQQLIDGILEDLDLKNSEVVEESSVFKEEQSISENLEAAGELLTDPNAPRDVRLISEIMRPTNHDGIVLQTPDSNAEPSDNSGKVPLSEDASDTQFDNQGNPVYPTETPSELPPSSSDDAFPDDFDEDFDADDDDDDEDFESSTGAKMTNSPEMELKGMPMSESVEEYTEFTAYDDVEVPAPTLKENEVPGSEEVKQAEEILGLRQSGVKQETLDGVMHKPNYRKAYALLQTASSQGNDKAKVLLGFAHLTGDHEPYVSHNTSLAYEMFEKAAKSGLPSAQRALGIMFSSGIEADSNQAKALLYYTFAALGGDSLAQMALAFRYWSGISVAQSCESALKYYRLVADTVARKVGSTGSGQVVLRIRLMEEEESPQNSPLLDEDLVQYYQFLADKGDLQAQLGLGQLYLQGGRGIEKNIKLAQNYFSAAAKSGNTNAYGFMGKISMQLKEYDVALKYYKLATKDPMGQWGMGTLYYNGWGVDQDYSQALTYFTLASQQGHTEAELQLGLMHLSGVGVKKDYGIALKHFNVASKSGHVLAFYNLGMMHAMGIGVMRNCQTAAELLKNVAERGAWGNELMEAHALYHKGFTDSALIKYLILAEQGYEVAQANVAFILDKDETDFISNLKSRYKRAFVNWKRAAAQGFGGARLKLGDYYYYGQGTDADPVEAAEQYQIASDVDHNPQAMFNLGYMHELGIGRAQDMHLAKRYYDMAASASVDAHVPTMLANAKLLAKLHIEWLIQFYKEFTFTMLYDSVLVWYTSWVVYLTDKVETLSEFFVQLDETATEDWDIYLMSILAVVLGLVMALRGHNIRMAQQQNMQRQPPNQ
ncbi:hypothetical protein ACHWQZ_G018301 [Mnemiopsis leidyi]